MSDTFLGWYFAHPDERLANGDGRKIVLGETHKVEGPPILCKHGLHASPTVLDATRYAKSAILYRVSLSGEVVHGDDKSCATERAYLARLDAADILRKFARECALSVINLWDAPSVVRRYLTTGDEDYRDAAHNAARDATRTTTAPDVWAVWAAWTARAAASAAAEDAARVTAEDAARVTARAADASRKRRFEQAVLDAINEVRT